MMPITEEVHAFLTANAAAQIQRDDEYLDAADGLLHCKTCHGLRQTVIPAPGGTGFLRPRCLCPCQSAAEKQRKAAEEKQERLERIQRRKAHGLQDRRLYDCTFANDNGKTPGLTAKAKRYVEHWRMRHGKILDCSCLAMWEPENPFLPGALQTRCWSRTCRF